jgi:hypothetical protein
METKGYKVAEAHNSMHKLVYKFPKRRKFDDLKIDIGEAFFKGITYIRLFEDYRYKNSFLEINKSDFSESFPKECYEKKQVQNQIGRLNNRIKDAQWNVDYYSNLKIKLVSEVKELEEQYKSLPFSLPNLIP